MLILNSYQLKWIAIVGMVLNHLVIGWWEAMPFWLALPLYAAGGVTFPIMAFLAVEGYKKTSDFTAYVGRLVWVGVIASLFHPLVFGMFMFNILFTLALGLLCIKFYDWLNGKWLFWLLFPLICLLTLTPITFDWAITGLIMMVMYHVITNENQRTVLPALVMAIVHMILMVLGALAFNAAQSLLGTGEFDMLVTIATAGKGMDIFYLGFGFAIGMLAAIWFIRRYNGERGKPSKWLFYVIYPLHLALIGAVAVVMGWVDLSVFFPW